MTLISKTAGCLSIISCAQDIHKTALIYSRDKYVKTSANSTIEKSINMQKANNLSYKDAQRKNWLDQSDFFTPIKEIFAKTSGYIEGVFKSSIRYIPNFALATIAILAGKNCKIVQNATDVAKATKTAEKIANVAALGLGVVEGIDFTVNSLGVGQRNDYLKL